jgi:CRP-like cAMP-binding protein
MPLTAEQLDCIPLLRGIDSQVTAPLVAAFERLRLGASDTLFREGEPASAFYLLTDGELAIREGDTLRHHLSPVCAVGELGALAGLTRNTTARATKETELWVIGRERLLQVLDENRDLALPFYQNLVEIIADKVRRDQMRVDDMRKNIIRTQKAMKQMRELLLESEETPLSEALHDTLDRQIQHNRRINYRVEPPRSLTATVRLDGTERAPVAQLSRTHLRYRPPAGPLPPAGTVWSAVLELGGPEIPVSGRVIRILERFVDIELDLLIDAYGAELDGYLTRVQMLDFMV